MAKGVVSLVEKSPEVDRPCTALSGTEEMAGGFA